MMVLSLRERKKVSGWNYRGSNGYCRHDRIKHGVLNFAIAQNANTKLEIGDVTIPKFWAHTGLWLWQVQVLLQSRFPKFIFRSPPLTRTKIWAPGKMVASNYWLTIDEFAEFDNILADRSKTETCMEMFLVVVEIRDEVTYQFLSYDQGTLEHRSLRVAAASTSLKQKFKVLISAPIGLQIPTRIGNYKTVRCYTAVKKKSVYGPDGTFAIVREFMIDGSLRMSYSAKIRIVVAMIVPMVWQKYNYKIREHGKRLQKQSNGFYTIIDVRVVQNIKSKFNVILV
ncbi:hypothetical protein Tco_0491611 [Tanacetum coccineum]